MKPLIILVAVFLAGLGITALMSGNADLMLSGRIAMGVMLLFTAIGHFKFSRGMAMMIPTFVPAKVQFVILTGILEVVAAVGIVISSSARITGILLIIFFLLVLPANINAALKKIDYEKGTTGGPGSSYLWFRVPLQILFITWVYWFAVR